MAESAVPIRRTKSQLWLWYENAPSNQSRCRLSPGESCRVLDRRSMAHRENVVRGLVPRWGRGGAWQNPPCHFAVPIHNSVFSYPGVPAPAGMSDCYESMSRTTIRDALKRLSSAPGNPFVRHSGEGRNPEGWGGGNVVRSKTSRREGLVPRWGGGGASQNPRCQFAVPSHNSGFGTRMRPPTNLDAGSPPAKPAEL